MQEEPNLVGRQFKETSIVNTIRKVAGFALIAILALFAALWMVTGGYDDPRREEVIRTLIRSGASRDQVTQELPDHVFVDYTVASPRRAGLEQYLAREARLTSLRERIAQYPGVWFHTTAWTQTWLFFDSNGRLRDYYATAQ